jgi:exonuclease III
VQKPINTVISNRIVNATQTSAGVNICNFTAITLLKDSAHKARDILSCGYLNARSVNNKASEVADFIAEKHMDICAISETWLHSGSNDIVCGELVPPGYKLQHVPRRSGRGGGVAVVCKTTIKAKKQKAKGFSSFEHMELLLTTRNDCIRLCVLYRPPKGGKHSKPFSCFLTEFQEYMDSLSTGLSTGGKLVVVGDFNIPMDSISCTDTTKFKDLLYSLSLIQHVNMPTHQHGHILDLVITRSFDNCIQNIITHLLHVRSQSTHFSV